MPDQIRSLQNTDDLVKKNAQLHKVGVGQQVRSNKPISKYMNIQLCSISSVP